MNRQSRVASVVEESWGTSVVYDVDTPDEKEKPVTKVKELTQTRKISSIKSFIKLAEAAAMKKSLDQIDEEEKSWYLNYFQASLFAAALEDAITQLRILASLFAAALEDAITQLRILVECNTPMRIIKTMSDMKLLLALKYGVEQPPVLDELAGIDPKNLGCLEYSLNKLDADRTFVGDVMVMTYVELSINKSYKILIHHVNVILDRDKHLAWLEEDEAKNKIIRKELAKQLRQQRNHHKSVIYDADAIIDNLRTQVEDASLMAEIKSRYVGNWQESRTEQHKQVIHEKESVNTDSIEFYKRRTDHEQRVHGEIELLTNIVINETLQKVEEWMDKYEKDMEKIDLKIQIIKNDYANMLDKRRRLDETLERHGQQMKAWVQFKEDREKARQYHDKMMNAAITVQAWWRGLLVRRELGPYKPKKRRRK